MKPQLLIVNTSHAYSFNLRHDHVPVYNNRLHYHSKLELIYLEKGSGTQFVGNNIKTFKDGDIVLIGSNLPHFWRFDEKYLKQDVDNSAEITVAHFDEAFCGAGFFTLPESKPIVELLKKAKHGIQVLGENKPKIVSLMKEMMILDPFKRLLALLEILYLIASQEQIHLLSSNNFSLVSEDEKNERIKSVFEYSKTHFKENITLQKIADIACMSPNAFCRYFKKYANKTYSDFIVELRVQNACKLLIEDRSSIQQICFDSGFNNFANFHRSFKKQMSKTPLQYKNEFILKLN